MDSICRAILSVSRTILAARTLMRSALNTEYTQRQGLDFARYEIQRPSHAPPPRLAILLSLTAARRHLCLDPLHGTRSDAAFSQNGALKKRLDKPRYRAGPRNPRAVSARGGPTVRISLPPAASLVRTRFFKSVGREWGGD